MGGRRCTIVKDCGTGSARLKSDRGALGRSAADWVGEAINWAGPHAVMRRAEFAAAAGKRLARAVAPERFLAETIGPVAAA